MIYYLTAAMLLGAAVLPRSDVRWAMGWLAIALVLALGGLRFEVGTDWDSYREVFNQVAQGESFSDLREENGFLSLASGFQFLSTSYPGFIFALFALSFSLKLYAIFRFRADVVVSLIVYFYSALLIYDVNGLRQGLALGFVMCAGWFAVQSRPLAYLGAMLLAASMHTVALVALPVYWMANVSWINRKPVRFQYVVVGSAMVFGYALSRGLAQTEVSTYLELINLAGRYYHYIDNFEQAFSPFGLGSLQRIFILGLAIWAQRRLVAPERVTCLLVNTYITATFIFFVLSFNIEFMARVSFYYKIFDIILISLIFKSLKTPLEICAFLGFLATLLFGSIYQLLSIPEGGLVPYRFQFFD
jgi:EpsG family